MVKPDHLVRELRLSYVPAEGTPPPPMMDTPSTLGNMFVRLLQHEAVEVFMIALLNTKLRLLGVYTVSRGTLCESLVHPREVFKAALLANAAAIATAHNHPSGITTPSSDDLATFKRINEAGTLLGVDVVDHFIVGQSGYYNYTDNRS